MLTPKTPMATALVPKLGLGTKSTFYTTKNYQKSILKQPMSYTSQKDNFIITTAPNTFDIDIIHAYLTRSYWKCGVPKELVSQSIKHSFCFGLFDQKTQIGFARVITDYTDFAYLCDLFVLEPLPGPRIRHLAARMYFSLSQLAGLAHLHPRHA